MLRGQIEGLYTAPKFTAKDAAGKGISARNWVEGTRLGHDGAMDHLIGFLREQREHYRLIAVGHRVVHGGMRFSEPTLVNTEALTSLEKYIPLAPLHQPHNLAPIRVVAERRPRIAAGRLLRYRFPSRAAGTCPGIRTACLHHGMRRAALRFSRLVLRIYRLCFAAFRCQGGFRQVWWSAHLGNGASMCAIKAGASVATTMGFTAVEGLPMGTRCGSMDPGVMLYLMDELKMDARAIEKLIYQQSGLLGVSGISSDMRANCWKVRIRAPGKPSTSSYIA